MTQKQSTSTSLGQSSSALACAKQSDTQVETPLKLGNCAELVALAFVVEVEELVVLVAVPVAVDWLVVIVLPLEVEEETVEDAPCDHTIEMNSWIMKNKGMGMFIVLV